MGQFFSRPLIGSILAMTLGLGTGCSHWIELAAPIDTAPPASATVATDARVPLLLETIRVTQNGSSIAPPVNPRTAGTRCHRSDSPLLSTLSIRVHATDDKPGSRHGAFVDR